MSRLYFAYGSNMLATRLLARTPGAHSLGPAAVSGWRVAFEKHAPRERSGKATLIRGTGCHGVLYEVPEADWPALDAAEGLGVHYTRHPVEVTTADGARQALTYFARQRIPDLIPFDWYLALCLLGAEEHGLPRPYIRTLRNTAWRPDPVITRKSFRIARTAFTAAGHHRWHGCLSGKVRA